MFITKVLFFCCFLLTLHATEHVKYAAVNPYDLVDEVRALVAELRLIVRGEVSAASGTLDGYVDEVYDHRNNALNQAEIAMQQEHDALNTEITNLKGLAESAGQNVDVCTANDELLFNQLLLDIIESLRECLALANRELTIINNEAYYRITVSMNEVNRFDYQLDLCSGDLLCIEPLVTQIELAEVDIPQKIGIEVQRANDLFTLLKVSVQNCADAKVAQFVAEGGIIAKTIVDCINNLLS